MRPGKAACLAVASAAAVFSAHAAPFAPAQSLVREAQVSIADLVDGPQFADAAFSLEQYHELAGTYDGAGVEGRRISVVWATDRAYCVEGVSQSGAVEYLLGPHGHVAKGRCPSASY